jgi:hypothetical protein
MIYTIRPLIDLIYREYHVPSLLSAIHITHPCFQNAYRLFIMLPPLKLKWLCQTPGYKFFLSSWNGLDRTREWLWENLGAPGEPPFLNLFIYCIVTVSEEIA